ncbi:MAG: hypothetical protein FWG80_01105, partial [Alphaproteobacteria bacterium]|nr:hypothetical protein [Alphaproteobacteria bacterium]
YDRLGEMRGLQAQNAQDTRLVATTMPGTFDELSFTERMDILKQGYEPWRAVYKDGKCIENCAYRTNFDIETNEQRRDREKAELAHMKEMNYCKVALPPGNQNRTDAFNDSIARLHEKFRDLSRLSATNLEEWDKQVRKLSKEEYEAYSRYIQSQGR